MARTLGSNIKTQAKMAKLGLKIAPRKLAYMSTDNRVLVTVGDNKMYISAKKAGGEIEMFYAAAGIRNYMEKHNKKPIAGAKEKILNRAKNAHKSRHVWEKRYEKGKAKNPFRKSSPELVSTADSIRIESPRLIDLEIKTHKVPSSTFKHSKRGVEAFETVLQKSIQKGIITTHSAAPKVKKGHNNATERIQDLGLNLDHRYLTFYNGKKEGPKVTIRITTKNGLQISQVLARDFNGDESQMFMASDKLRRHILRTGHKPTDIKAAHYFAEVANGLVKNVTTRQVSPKVAIATKEQKAPSSTKPTVPNDIPSWGDVTQKEQPSKSIFTKLKMWVFG